MCLSERQRDGEKTEEREVIIVGGITLTSGPAWAKLLPCFCVCEREREGESANVCV